MHRLSGPALALALLVSGTSLRGADAPPMGPGRLIVPSDVNDELHFDYLRNLPRYPGDFFDIPSDWERIATGRYRGFVPGDFIDRDASGAYIPFAGTFYGHNVDGHTDFWATGSEGRGAYHPLRFFPMDEDPGHWIRVPEGPISPRSLPAVRKAEPGGPQGRLEPAAPARVVPAAVEAGPAPAPAPAEASPPQEAEGAKGHLGFYRRWLGPERPSEADLSRLSAAELLVRGDARMRGGLFLEASGDYAVAVLKEPNDARAHLRFSDSLLALSEFRLAGKELALALEADPGISPKGIDPSASWPDPSLYGERVRALGRAFEANPGSAEGLVLGFHRIAAGDGDGARRALGVCRREEREGKVAAALLAALDPANPGPAPPAPGPVDERPAARVEPPAPSVRREPSEPPADPGKEALARATIALRERRFADALAAFRAAVAAEPDGATGLVGLGLALAAEGNLPPAAAAVAAGLARDGSFGAAGRPAEVFGAETLARIGERLAGAEGKTPAHSFLCGWLAAARGDDAEAARELKGIPADRYEFDGARRLLDAVAARTQKESAAPEAAPAALATPAPAPAAPAAGPTGAGILPEGDRAYRDGRFEDAVSSYRRACEGESRAEALAALSEAAFAAGDFRLASEALLAAFAADPAWFEGRFAPRLPVPGRGLEGKRLGELRAKAAPADLPVRVLLAVREIWVGDLDEAAAALGGGAGDDPAVERARRFFAGQIDVLRSRARSIRDSM